MTLPSWLETISETLIKRVLLFDRSGMLLYGHPRVLACSRFGKSSRLADTHAVEWPIFEEIMRTGSARLGIHLEGEHEDLIVDAYPVAGAGGNQGLIFWVRQTGDVDTQFGLNQLSAELQALVNSSYDGMWISDNQGNIVQINKRYEEQTGINIRELIGRNCHDLLAEGLYDQLVTLEVLKQKKMVTRVVNRFDGRRFLTTGNPVFDKHGDLQLVLVNDWDLTEFERLRDDILAKSEMAHGFHAELIDFNLNRIEKGKMVYRSNAMEKVIDAALRAAKFNSNVLLTGPSGCGKQRIAELIHQRSTRASKPIMQVNCGAIPESLFESEIFGYEKGAFTGAGQHGKPGIVELADNSSLFLDEIAETPLAIQVKLLKFLDDGLVFRVGSTVARRVNVRIIAATNRDLATLVAQGKFRDDLYYRLNVVPIHIPPLRTRKEDIPVMVEHFITKFAKEIGEVKKISIKALDCLMAYDYPGNVRELVNICENLTVMSPEKTIRIEDLPAHIQKAARGGAAEGVAAQRVFLSSADAHTLKERMADCERQILLAAAQKHTSKVGMALELGVNKSTITRKLRKHNIRSTH